MNLEKQTSNRTIIWLYFFFLKKRGRSRDKITSHVTDHYNCCDLWTFGWFCVSSPTQAR